MDRIAELKRLMQEKQEAIETLKKDSSLSRYPSLYQSQLIALQNEYSALSGELRGLESAQNFQAIREQAHQNGEAYRAAREEERQAQEQQDKLARQEEMRIKALSTWIEGGGSVEGFDQNWESIKIELLKAQTIQALTAPAQPTALERWKARTAARVVAQ